MNDKARPKIKKIKLKRSQKLTKFGQKIYLCCSNFQKNTLWESASSCSFGFIFSLVPLILIILTIMVGIVRVSPEIIDYFLAFASSIESVINITPLINNILHSKNFHFVDIFLAIWILWMARRLGLSIAQAMTKIFRAAIKRKNIFNQLFAFFTEFLIIVVITSVIILSFSLNQLASSRFFEPIREYLPDIVSQNSHTIISIIMYFIFFICTLFIYRVMSGTKPPLYLCIFYATLSTIGFFVISFLINKFMNLTNYNIVYGTISTIVILMMRIYFFFIFFLFNAQMIYITQFFDTLLLSEIYLLSSDEKKGWLKSFQRMMFINPAALITTENMRTFKSGDIIFTKGDKAEYVYYLYRGEMVEETEQQIVHHEKGDFIGEIPCILNQPQPGDGVAITACRFIVFTKEEFRSLMQKSPKAASKAISKISEAPSSLSDMDE